MKILLATVAALLLAWPSLAQAQNTAAEDAGVVDVQAKPAPAANPAVKAPAEPAAKKATSRPAAQAAPAAANTVAAGPDDLGEQPINASPFDPTAQTQDTAGADSADDSDSYRGPTVAFPLIIAGLGFLALSGLALYFLPTIIALVRRKRNSGAIFALNLLLGWSFIGWVAALIWAIMADAP